MAISRSRPPLHRPTASQSPPSRTCTQSIFRRCSSWLRRATHPMRGKPMVDVAMLGAIGSRWKWTWKCCWIGSVRAVVRLKRTKVSRVVIESHGLRRSPACANRRRRLSCVCAAAGACARRQHASATFFGKPASQPPKSTQRVRGRLDRKKRLASGATPAEKRGPERRWPLNGAPVGRSKTLVGAAASRGVAPPRLDSPCTRKKLGDTSNGQQMPSRNGSPLPRGYTDSMQRRGNGLIDQINQPGV